MDVNSLTNILLTQPMWRLTSGEIYKIYPNKKEGVVPYRPRPEHVEIFQALIEEDVEQLMLLKARRPGFSTALGLFSLDMAIFNPGVQISIIDQSQGDASKKLDRIICLALDNIPDWLRARVKIGPECGKGGSRNGEQVSVSLDDKQRSDIYAGKDARGGTNDLLWVSEWGVIQYEDASRSARIRSGALPSARDGVKVVETTWQGGKSGDVWDLIDPVLKGASDDWKILFCPWWRDPRNTDSEAQMSETAFKYFEKIADRAKTAGITFTDGQKRWWAAEKRNQGIYMARENPTFLTECWEAPAPGSIYGEVIDQARSENRVIAMPVNGGQLVHTFWDLGAPRQTRVAYIQSNGPWWDVIDIDPPTDETLVQRIARMRQKGYFYGSHYLPHDSQQTKTSGHTLATEFAAHWLKVDPELIGSYDAGTGKKNFDTDYRKAGLRFVPRTMDLWVGINHGLQIFNTMRFRSPACDDALGVLAMYRVAEVKEGKAVNPEPVHDFSSHCFTKDTEVLTPIGTHCIGSLPCTGTILTPIGWAPFRNPRITRRNAQLVRVRFCDGLTVRCTPDHLFATDSGWKSAESLLPGSLIQSRSIPTPSFSGGGFIECGRENGILPAPARAAFTGMYGSPLLVRFRRDAMSITGMRIPGIAALKTLNARQGTITSHSTAPKTTSAGSLTLHPRLAPRQKRGINPKKGESGTRKSTGCAYGRMPSISRGIVWNVEASLCGRLPAMGTPRPNSAPMSARLAMVESVEPLLETEDVWCLTVPGVEAFCLANGAVVHNCADAFRTFFEAQMHHMIQSSAPNQQMAPSFGMPGFDPFRREPQVIVKRGPAFNRR